MKKRCKLTLRGDEPNLVWKLKFMLEQADTDMISKHDDPISVAWNAGYKVAITECLAQLGFDTSAVFEETTDKPQEL